MSFTKNHLVVVLLLIAHLSKAAEQGAADQKQYMPEAADQSISAQEILNQDLMQAIDQDDIVEAKRCIDRKADVNYINDDWSCLLSAKSTSMATLLIEHKADVNLAIDGEFTLHRAVDLGEKALVKILLEHKADVKVREDIYQDTPLHMVHDEEIAQLLLAANADPDAENVQKNTPLQVVVFKGWGSQYGLAVMKKLIEHKADVDHKNGQGQTALNIAFRQKNKETAECLLQAKASMIIKNDAGVSPLDIAFKSMRIASGR